MIQDSERSKYSIISGISLIQDSERYKYSIISGISLIQDSERYLNILQYLEYLWYKIVRDQNIL